ncbi:hypothetical protein HX773_24505 [Pantoea sp. B9002]|uniref:hypothetical protein n=1 Tax=Pantoea sp. B9002 TaxID=2726979 RepID=UPI0015A0BA7C|nr:hypothetical protein [Pantoea sp. B9002]NWA64063.1 hypothetical protein [Pantoea sp. B9002]
MKKIALAILISSVSFGAFSAPYIDASTKKTDTQRKDYIKKETVKNCGGKASYSCESKVFDAANKKFPMRGSAEFSKENYAKLSKSQATSKLNELGVAYNKAEPFSNKKEGEVTQPQLEREGWWIVKNVLKIDRYKYQLVKPWVNEKGVPLKGLNPSA